MTDLDLRSRELRWRASGTVEAERAYRRAQLRAGVLDHRGLEGLAALHAFVRADDPQTLTAIAQRSDGILTHVVRSGLERQRVIRATSTHALRELLRPAEGLRVSHVEVRSRLELSGGGEFAASGTPWNRYGEQVRIQVHVANDRPSQLIDRDAIPPALLKQTREVLGRRALTPLPLQGLQIRICSWDPPPDPQRWYRLGWALDNALDRAVGALQSKVLEPWVALTVHRLRDARTVAQWVYRRGGWITWQDERVLCARLPLRRVRKLRRTLVRMDETEAVLTWDVVEHRPTPNWLADELLTARWQFGWKDGQNQPRYTVDRS